MNCNKNNLILIGMPGCGKSTIGEKLAQMVNWSFIDVDHLIEESTGKKIPELFQVGEEHFRDIESDIVRSLEGKTSNIVSTGGGVVKREENIFSLKKHGLIIFVNRDPAEIIKDIDVESRPLLSNKRETILRLYDERFELYKKYCDVEIKNDSTMEEVISRILDICREVNLL